MSTNKSKTQAENPEQTGIHDQAGNSDQIDNLAQKPNPAQADHLEPVINSDELDNQPTTNNLAIASNESEQAVQFINQEVLNQTVTPITGMSKPLVDQAAAMMVQDMQSFLQGNEQILTVATAKALAYSLDASDPAKQAAGLATLTAINGVMVSLTTYSTGIGTAAAAIASEFNG